MTFENALRCDKTPFLLIMQAAKETGVDWV